MSYARVMSVLALVLATAATAWAASLPRNSVRSATIKNGHVKARDVGRDAVTGAKVANGSLVARKLARGVARPGPKGATGAEGPVGDQGDTGPSAVSRERVAPSGPFDIGSMFEGPVLETEYAAEPGRMVTFAGRMNVTRNAGGTCPSVVVGLEVSITVGADDRSLGNTDTFRSGALSFSGTAYVDPLGAATVPLAIVVRNECTSTWRITGLQLDVVHVN